MRKTLILITSITLCAQAFILRPSTIIEFKDDYQMYVRQRDINSTRQIKNVIMFIGDGMGPNHVSAGSIFKGIPLTFANESNTDWTYHGYVNTDSRTSEGYTLDTSKSLILPELNSSLYDGTPSPYGGAILGIDGENTCFTDSAAGGTALATGKKTTNSTLGMDIDGSPLTNLVEIANGLGKKTGVISTDEVSGATPASFLAHVPYRHQTADILTSIAKDSRADLIVAKSNSTYTNDINKYENLFKENNFDNIAYDLTDIELTADRILLLLPQIMARGFRTPSLAELTVMALDYLDNDEGFFLMVEGANIDKRSHSNLALDMLYELLAFEDAVYAAQLWAKNRDDTIIIVTADHETGGLYYDRSIANRENIPYIIKWLTSNHSRTRVRIDVYGNINEFILKYDDKIKILEGKPYLDNTDIFKIGVSYL